MEGTEKLTVQLREVKIFLQQDRVRIKQLLMSIMVMGDLKP